MIWVVVVIVGLLIVGGLSAVSSASKKSEENRKFEAGLDTRVLAEMDRLRRESQHQGIARMTDNELRDLVVRSARSLSQEINIANNIGAFIAAAGFLFGVFVAVSEQKWGPLFGFVVAGLGVGYFVSQAIIASMKKKYAAQGLDPKRLEIQT